jgi:predicted transcriptional regulator
MSERRRAQPPKPANRRRGKGERKAVLNVTVSESVADQVRQLAALENSTISSVVERALSDQLDWEIKRLKGIAAIEAYFREHGYPSAEEIAEADAWVETIQRLLAEAREANRDIDAPPRGGAA